jgi:hypothetical protein
MVVRPQSLTGNGRNKTTGQTTRAISMNPPIHGTCTKKSDTTTLSHARKWNMWMNWGERDWAPEQRREKRRRLDEAVRTGCMIRWRPSMRISRVSDRRMQRCCEWRPERVQYVAAKRFSVPSRRQSNVICEQDDINQSWPFLTPPSSSRRSPVGLSRL